MKSGKGGVNLSLETASLEGINNSFRNEITLMRLIVKTRDRETSHLQDLKALGLAYQGSHRWDWKLSKSRSFS